jgi:ComF family protein
VQHVQGIRSACLFEGTLREAIHRFKYRNMRALAQPLGGLLVDAWHPLSQAIEVLVPVPLHRRRLRERGYNQSHLLALRLGAATGVPVVGDTLRRVRYTASQTHLGTLERRENVANAFAVADDRLRGKRVALVDDVCTTGATIEACGAALMAEGVGSVWALTVARAV